jgi:hypothetical protein
MDHDFKVNHEGVEYQVTATFKREDNSFTHGFGTEKRLDWDLVSYRVWVDQTEIKLETLDDYTLYVLDQECEKERLNL